MGIDSEYPVQYAPEQLEREIRARWSRFLVAYLARALFGGRAPVSAAAGDPAAETVPIGITATGAAAVAPANSVRWLLRSRGFWLVSLLSVLALWQAGEAPNVASFVARYVLWLVGLGLVGWVVLIWRLVFTARLEGD